MKQINTKCIVGCPKPVTLALLFILLFNLCAFGTFAQTRKLTVKNASETATLGNLLPGAPVWDQSQFDVTNGWDIAGAVVAENFQIVSPRRLTLLTIWLGDAEINDNGALDSFSGTLGVAIYADNAGAPGTLLHSFSLTPALSDTGLQSGTNSDVVRVDATFPVPVNLVAGMYWVAVHDGAWGSGDDLSPVYTLTTPVTFGAGNMGAFPTPSPDGWTIMANGFDCAFQLRAEAAWDQTTPIDLPGLDITNSAIADDFTVGATATLTGFSAILTDDSVNNNGTLDSFNGTLGWVIYSDNLNAPGMIVATDNATPFLLDTGMNSTAGQDMVRAEVNFLTNVVLPPGNYWFALREGANGSPVDGTVVRWANTPGISGNQPQLILFPPDPNAGLFGSTDVAFGLWGLAPTAASATVSGRVTTASGTAVRNASVSLTGLNGNVLNVRTNSFGYFKFTDVPSGENYLLGASAKRHRFTPQLISVTDNVTDVVIASSE